MKPPSGREVNDLAELDLVESGFSLKIARRRFYRYYVNCPE
jgi:hypothetical protein